MDSRLDEFMKSLQADVAAGILTQDQALQILTQDLGQDSAAAVQSLRPAPAPEQPQGEQRGFVDTVKSDGLQSAVQQSPVGQAARVVTGAAGDALGALSGVLGKAVPESLQPGTPEEREAARSQKPEELTVPGATAITGHGARVAGGRLLGSTSKRLLARGGQKAAAGEAATQLAGRVGQAETRLERAQQAARALKGPTKSKDLSRVARIEDEVSAARVELRTAQEALRQARQAADAGGGVGGGLRGIKQAIRKNPIGSVAAGGLGLNAIEDPLFGIGRRVRGLFR